MRSLFGAKPQELYGIQAKGDVLTAFIEINPEVYVLHNGVATRLVDILNLKAGKGGKFLLPLRGTKTKTGEEIWPGRQIIEALNRPGNLGKSQATGNMVNYGRFINSYSKMTANLFSAKLETNLLSSLGEVERLINATSPGMTLEARTGSLYNLVDPFMPIDNNLLNKKDKLIRDYSKIDVYGDIRNQGLGTQSYVGNTFVSISKVQDTDSDTMQTLLIALKDNTGKVVGHRIFDKKYPHTVNQLGSKLVSSSHRDFEGETYDPLKVYRRAAGIFGTSAGTEEGLVGAHGNQGIAKGLAKTAELAKGMAVSTYRDRQQLSALIQKSLKENLTGMYTSKQWQYESYQAEKILSDIPTFLAENYQATQDQIEEVMLHLQSPGARAKFKFALNQGFKGARLEGTETIQKSRSASDLKALFARKEFEAMALTIGYDTQARLMSKGDLSALGDLAALGVTENFLAMTPEQRLMAAYGLSSPKMKTVNAFDRKLTPEIKFTLPEGIKVDTGDGRKGYLLDSLINTQIMDRNTGATSPMLQIQEISFDSDLGREYLSSLPESQRKNATKGYIVTMNSLDEAGNIIRTPLSGAHPGVNQRGTKELSWVLTSTYDTIQEKWIDPLDLLRNKLEVASQHSLSMSSGINRYGFGELTGAYSLQNLSKGGKYARELATANKVTVERVMHLAKMGNAGAIQTLKNYKAQRDLASAGDIGTTIAADIGRLLKQAFGGMGVEAEIRRDLNGNMFFANESARRHIAEMTTIYTGFENLDASAKAAELAKAAAGGQMLAGMKESKTDETISYGLRGMIKGDNVVSPLSTGTLTYDPKRLAKRVKIGQLDLDLGKTNVAIVTFDVKKKAMENLGYKYNDEKGDFEMMSGIENALYGNKDKFQAEYFDEGVLLGTDALQKKMEQTILRNMEPGVDYASKQHGEFQFEYKIYDPLSDKYIVRYTKAPLETQRLLSNRTGSVRIIPTFGALKSATTSINGVEQEVDALLTLGEALAKGLMPQAIEQKVEELAAAGDKTIVQDFHNAVAEAGKDSSNQNKTLIDNFVKRLQAGAASDVKIRYGEGEESNIVGALVYSMNDATIRNLEADKQIHAMSGAGTYIDKIKAFAQIMDNNSLQQLDYSISGQGAQDSFFEIAKGMHTFLAENDVIDPTQTSDIDIADVMFLGYDRMSNTHGPAANHGSLLDQMTFTKREYQIEKAARALRLGTHATQGMYRDVRMAENEAILNQTIDNQKQTQAAMQAYRSAFNAAVGENLGGLMHESADTIMRAFFGALG